MSEQIKPPMSAITDIAGTRWAHAITLAGVMLLAGCVTQPAGSVRPQVIDPEPAPVVEGQDNKDVTVLGSTDRIDGIVKNEPAVAAPVKVETDAIRAAVAANPAEDVKVLAAKFEEAIKLLREQLAAADKNSAKLTEQIARLEGAEQRKQVRDLRYFAFGALALAALLGWARQIQFAAILAVGGILAFGLAQLVSQPWFMTACTVVVGLVLAGSTWAAVHAYRKHELAAKVEKEAAKLKDTLTRVVPAVDSVIEQAGDAADNLKTKLREAMTGDAGKVAKATIHEIRAAAKLT